MFRFTEIEHALDEIYGDDGFQDWMDEINGGDVINGDDDIQDRLDEINGGDVINGDDDIQDRLDEINGGDVINGDDDIQDRLDEINGGDVINGDDDIQDWLDEINGGDEINGDDDIQDWLDEINGGDEINGDDEIQDWLDEINGGGALSKSNKKPNFEPKWSQKGHRGQNKAINAIIEIRALWDYVIQEARRNYSNMYSKLSIPISEELKRECKRHKENFAVYDRKTRKWLIKSNEPKYDYCYDGIDFKEFKFVKSVMTGNRFLLVGKYTILSQEPNLLLKTRTAMGMFDMFTMPALKLIVGVPGCGKTTHIINNHSPGNLVLSSCAQAAEDIRNRMALKHRGTPDGYRKSYRTIDSYLLHNRERCSTVWVDEALMEHPGKLFLVCLYSHCRNMYMLGDPNQLGYINRVDGIKLLYDKSSIFFKPSETLNISYRCPVDVMAVLSSKYDGGAYSASKYTRSMTCQRFTTLECVPKSKKIKYLVFKQAEKQLMAHAKYDVSTIHEFQGKEADDVVIVRMSRNQQERLYKSVPHMLVGISRHKVSLVYYTPVHDDLQTLIETPLTGRDLMKVKKT